MRIAAVMIGTGATDVFEAQAAFHVAAGADVVLVASTTDVSSTDLLGRFAGHDAVRVVIPPARCSTSTRGLLAGLALAEHEVDWVLDVRSGEFWWPRGESLQDVLAPMPQRYGIVQGLVRSFAAVGSAEGPFHEQLTVRSSLLEHPLPPGVEPASVLRPVFRAYEGLDPDLPRGGAGSRQPLRAWYPFEVMTLPAPRAGIGDDAVAQGILDGALVVDERLRDALAAIEAGGSPTFPVPDVVDDAAYAGECAAVGEVDLESFDQQLRVLERRIAELEARFWPRVRRRLRRLRGGTSSH